MTPREPLDVRLIRSTLQRWPLARGKHLVYSAFRPLLARRRFVIEVEPNLYIHGDLEDRVVYWCFVDGYRSWEPAALLSHALIRPGDTVFDIGAHVGLWLLGAARRAGPTGSAHAFEPSPSNRERLLSNVALNRLSWIRCDARAVAEAPREAVLFEPSGDNRGLASLASRSGVDRAERVRTTTLDAYCAEQRISRIDVLKVDVEGAEALVFRGGPRLLSSDDRPVILFEANDDLSMELGASCADVKRTLAGFGYGVFRFDGHGLERVRDEERHSGEDLLGLAQHHRERFYPIELPRQP